MFGSVHYSDSTGRTILVVHCESEPVYRSAVDVACRWAEEDVTEDRRVWGHILAVAAAYTGTVGL